MNGLTQLQPANRENTLRDVRRIERVLVPVDFSASTAAALRYARNVAKEFDAVIHVLHVVRIVGGRAWVARVSLDAESRELMAAAHQGLGKLIGVLWGNEIPAKTVIREGRPYDVIVEEALAMRADLMVVGASGHTGLQGLFAGDTVQQVVRRAPCPVLVVPVRELACCA